MATTSGARKRQGPLKRLPQTDFSTAEEVLKSAAIFIVPEDQTQRQAFEKLMPHLYVLRNKGCSILQLTDLLNQCGFSLQPSTVRDYYRDALAKRMDLCQERMNEQMILLAEIRKQTEGSDFSEIVDRVNESTRLKKMQAASKIDAIFAMGSKSASHVGTPSFSESPAPAPVNIAAHKPSPSTSSSTARTISPKPEQIPKKNSEAENHESEFGLLNASSGDCAGGSKNNSPSSQDKVEEEKPSLRCSPLPEGISHIKKIANVPDHVYLPGELEHPAIKGLMLSLDQRLAPIHLEYVNESSGEILMESDKQQRFRFRWKTPIPMTISSTDSTFTEMDMSIFKKH